MVSAGVRSAWKVKDGFLASDSCFSSEDWTTSISAANFWARAGATFMDIVMQLNRATSTSKTVLGNGRVTILVTSGVWF
jgi:hypothetical protein